MKKGILSIAFVLFFLVCAVQPLAGRREDWPFSYFGMYKGTIDPRDVYRLDLDVVTAAGKRTSLYTLDVNASYFYDKLDRLLKKHFLDSGNAVLASPKSLDDGPEARDKVRLFLAQDVYPLLEANAFLPCDIVIRYRHWNLFRSDNVAKPDIDREVFRFSSLELGNR